MRAQQINRACTMGLIVLSLTALLDVLLLCGTGARGRTEIIHFFPMADQ